MHTQAHAYNTIQLHARTHTHARTHYAHTRTHKHYARTLECVCVSVSD